MRIVMDDAGDITSEQIEKYNIKIVPINIAFGMEQFTSGPEMDHVKFYEKVKTVTNINFPKTSQPTPYQFVQACQEIIAAGEKEILAITVSQKLSGTYSSAIQAQSELADQAKITVFNSGCATISQGWMAVKAAAMASEGASLAEILAQLEKMRDANSMVLTLDNLEFAVKGGRVGALRSTMATLLNIKPILKLNDGVLIDAKKVRTMKKAIQFMLDEVKSDVGDQPVMLGIMHAGVPDKAAELLEQARPYFNVTEATIINISIAVAINLGPGGIGIAAMPA